MGNCFRRLRDGDHSELDTFYPQYSYGGHEGGGYPSRPGPVTFTVVGFTAFARDLVEFETTNEGLLRFYHLPWPTVPAAKLVPAPATQPVPVSAGKLVPAGRPVPTNKLAPRKPEAQAPTGKQKRKPAAHAPACKRKKKPAAHAIASQPDREKPKLVEEIEYEIHTISVNWDKVKDKIKGDGDGFTVFVNVLKDAREAGLVPKVVQEAALSRQKAQAQKNYKMANALQKKIEAAEYK